MVMCDQDVCKADVYNLERLFLCVVNMVRSWLSLCQRSSYLVRLVTQMVRAQGRVQNGVRVCGRLCGIQA